MSDARSFRFPPEQEALYARARRLAWWSLVYTLSATVVLFVTMGGSQAMRANFADDAISTLPALVFLIAGRFVFRPPDDRYPYGFHSASIGYLTAGLALVMVGGFLLFEAGEKLLTGTRTTIGGMSLFGQTVWAGWPMLLALLYSGIPPFFLGRAKAKLAPQLHDKILFADAQMMKADWVTALATALGVIGIGLGLWWADPIAAGIVSFDILRDGARNTGAAVADLMKRRPRRTDGSAFEPLPGEIATLLERLDWVMGASVRLREDGHVFFGEAFVIPSRTDTAVVDIRDAVVRAKALNWRLRDLTVTLVDSLPQGCAPDNRQNSALGRRGRP